MNPLDRPLRGKLEKTVKEARDIAEAAARAALDRLGVAESAPFAHLSDEERELRRRLRAHGRQLGDALNGGPTQSMDALVEATAYEHWHRMLFARFLAENNLLMYDGVAVTIEECEELAADEGAANGWELAARYAARMLPQSFRPDSPVFQVSLPPERQQALERLVAGLPKEVFTASDSLGWVYQFWQAKRKEEVNASEVKIGERELPAVTQLFTEPYMVAFLLDNSLGAWWASRRLGEDELRHAQSEEELREKAAIPGVALRYLRFVTSSTSPTSPPDPLSINGEGEASLSPLPIHGNVINLRLVARAALTPPCPPSPRGRGGKVTPRPLGEGPGVRAPTPPKLMTLPIHGEGGRGGEVEGTSRREHSVTAHNFIAQEKLEAARRLRKEPTPKEAEVWEWLRNRRMLGLKWRRQQIIEGFIADFYCAEHHLALEIDGGVHQTDEATEYDHIRDQIFAGKGIKTLRVNNEDCTRDTLQSQIEQAVSPSSPLEKAALSPSPFMERGPGGEGLWSPAAGTFPSWPERLADLKMLDPCCGSGHFLVAALLMLAPMRMELEGLSAREAVDAVLRDNLHGLELDRRCVELAAFALALAAWTYPEAGGYRPLPELNLACCGLSVRAAREEWRELGLGKKNLALALAWLHETFQNAPALGSLLDPAGTDAAKLAQWGGEELSGALEQALAQEPDPEQRELAVAAKGLATAARLLGRRYHWVVTNVPYLARGKQGDILRDFCEKRYPAAKNDLATVFLERCLNLCEERGAACVVLPQNWLFLSSYKKFREQLLKRHTWRLVARLGPGAFEMISGEVVKAILLVISRGVEAASCHLTPPAPLSMNGEGGEKGVSPSPFMERGPGGEVSGLDVSECRTAADKAERLLTEEIRRVGQAKQLENPDNAIIFSDSSEHNLLKDSADGLAGILNGDSPRFQRQFLEFFIRSEYFVYQQGTVINTIHFGGLEKVIEYDEVNGHMRLPVEFRRERLHDSDQRGNSAWGKWGVGVSEMNVLPSTLYIGNKFDSNIGVVLPKEADILPAIWCYCSSPEYNENVRKIDQKLNVTNATLVKVPFDLARWQKVAAEQYPHGLPQPYSDDPTQWIFHGHPCGSVIWNEQTKRLEVASTLRMDDTVLQVAVARLLGYRWPAELDEGMELAEEQRGWARRSAELNGFADQDGIVCIPPVRGEPAAADRLLDLLAAAYGEAWNSDTLSALLTAADHAGKSLETWLRDKFFAQHCKLFQNRPFIWHIWDGQPDGFSVLVNYHRLDHKNLETLIYTYLGDWIARQKQDIAAGQDGAQERLAAAESLKKRLELILEGEAPHDIFVRWKPLDQQPIGWAPDLNDGVRLNIRPFMTAPDVRKRGAGLLRDKPNIKWEKDRGKDVASAPWYPVFHGDRINDHHLSLAEKRAAREGGR